MDQRILKVVTLLEEKPHATLGPAEMAQAVNLSLPRLRSLFRAETGESLARYQKLVRMREARRLLQDTFFSVKEIMLKVGIHDESHFVRDFKRIYGVTPTQCRTQGREPNARGKAVCAHGQIS